MFDLTNEKDETLIAVPGGTLGPANLGLEPKLGGGEDTLDTEEVLSTFVFFFCCSLESSLILLVLISLSDSESEESSESSSNRLLTSLIIELISSLLCV